MNAFVKCHQCGRTEPAINGRFIGTYYMPSGWIITRPWPIDIAKNHTLTCPACDERNHEVATLERLTFDAWN